MKKKIYFVTGLFLILFLFAISVRDANSICWKRELPFDGRCFGDITTACLLSWEYQDCNEEVEEEEIGDIG